MFPSVWHANTQIQLHKYTNTVLVKFADRHYMCYIFEKVMVRGPQKQCSRLSNVQLHKYTNKVWRWCTEGDKKLSYKGQGSQVSVWKMQNPPCLLCLVPPYFTLSWSSETVGFEARHKEGNWHNLTGYKIRVFKTTSKRFCMATIYVYKLNLGGQNNYSGGTKSVWSPTEFEGTKDWFSST